MYESVFGFDGRPFVEAVQVARYFPASAIEQAREALARCVDRAEGIGLLVGPAGTGKTLLCHLLSERFGEAFRIVMLSSARLCTRRALLQNILFELGLPYRDMEEGELRLTLIDHLQPNPKCPHGMLLLVDEAHCLPPRLLEEIRMITNLVRDGRPRVRLVLAGGPVLEERLASPRLESLNQRIAARCYLHTFQRDETCQYVRRQIAAVGGNEQVFSDDALSAVHTATDGIARLINQLCDHALMMASLGGHDHLDAAGIEEAWADLQQLPLPSLGPAQNDEESSGVVEFGQLDDTPQPETVESADDAIAVGALDPATQIEEIQRDIAQANDDSLIDDREEIGESLEPAQYEPIAGSQPEVELIFHGGHDPFGQQFDEEEMVVDRYASLDDDALENRPHVSSNEGRKLSEALSRTLLEASESDFAVANHNAAAIDPASDPVMPEPDARDERVADHPITDDHDLIVVVDDEQPAPHQPSPRPPGRAHRQEYRQLFSKLRQG